MQSIYVNGIQMIVLNQPEPQLTSRQIKPRLAKQLFGLGVVHTIIGVFCIVFQSINFDHYFNQSYGAPSLTVIGYGFWNGILFLVNGIIGMTAGVRKRNCQVAAFNVLSIISASTVWIMIILAALSAYSSFEWCEYQRRTRSNCSIASNMQATTLFVMDSMIAVMGVLEAIFAIWSSIVCCLIGVHGCCHANPPPPQTTQPMILSAEQQSALMSNPVFMPNQQRSVVGFYPQQQTDQYDKLQPATPQYEDNNCMPAAAVEGSYTNLTPDTRPNLASTVNDAPMYVELVYEEIDRPLTF